MNDESKTSLSMSESTTVPVDLYQQLTASGCQESNVGNGISAEPSREESSLVDLVLLAIMLASLALGFCS
ncbi:MAG: hypothetical protein KDA42_04310 [Planctomycetales bacterium]|nr:hypothetical protein [Planctomycetales bacterium]